MNLKLKLIFLSTLIVFISIDSIANVLWNHTGTTPPRHRNITREDQAPCGSTVRSASTEIPGGRAVELSWVEILPQQGKFEIYFSPSNDTDWVLLKTIPNIPTDFNATLILHKAQVELPNIACDNCTLQIVQVITAGVQSKYYSCADVKLNPNYQIEPTSPKPTACQ
jgi:hypothetical protein